LFVGQEWYQLVLNQKLPTSSHPFAFQPSWILEIEDLEKTWAAKVVAARIPAASCVQRWVVHGLGLLQQSKRRESISNYITFAI